MDNRISIISPTEISVKSSISIMLWLGYRCACIVDNKVTVVSTGAHIKMEVGGGEDGVTQWHEVLRKLLPFEQPLFGKSIDFFSFASFRDISAKYVTNIS